MPATTALLFGAGATAACGGPMTADILPDAYQAVREGADAELFQRVGLVIESVGLPLGGRGATEEHAHGGDTEVSRGDYKS